MFFSKLTQFVILSLSLVLGACMAPLDEDLEALPDERTEADPMATDFYGNIMSGQIWSSPAGIPGLGGAGREVSLGELQLPDEPPYPQQAVLNLSLQTYQPVDFLGRARLYAKITYGIGSANQTVLMDWQTGTSISLPAGKVNVSAIQTDRHGVPAYTYAGLLVPDPLDTFAVGFILTASLSSGERSSIAMPTLTQTVDLVAAVPVTLPAPQRAKRLLVADARGQLGTDLQVSVVGALGVQGYALANAADSAIRTEGIVLQGRVDNVQLLSPGGWTGVVVCWLLDG